MPTFILQPLSFILQPFPFPLSHARLYPSTFILQPFPFAPLPLFPFPYTYSGAISDSLQLGSALKISCFKLDGFLSALLLCWEKLQC